jgi:hypothetical protein
MIVAMTTMLTRTSQEMTMARRVGLNYCSSQIQKTGVEEEPLVAEKTRL